MNKLKLLLAIVFTTALMIIPLKINGAEITGYPPNIATYYKKDIYSDYFYMTTGKITVNQDMKTLIIYVPNSSFIVTSAGSDIEQNVTFYDENDNIISRVPTFGRLVGWFTYNIPEGTVKVKHEVLNKGTVGTDYGNNWNNQAYISYGDNLDVYQTAWNEGYDAGKSDGINVGRIKGYNDGKIDGKIEGEIIGFDNGYEEGISTVYYDGFGGIRNPFTDAFYKDEDSYSYGLGHQEGYEEGLGFDAFGWLKSIIYFIGWILNVQFIPGVSLGRIAMLVLFIYLIPFIFRMFGGSD